MAYIQRKNVYVLAGALCASLASFSLFAQQTIPQEGWRLVYVDSQETIGENGAAKNAFDGNPSTFWHTEWYYKDPNPPHEIQIDLGALYSISGMGYLSRQDGNWNGTIGAFSLYLSSDGRNWSSVYRGEFSAIRSEQAVQFSTTTARYAKLVAQSMLYGKPWSSAAEINFFGRPGLVAPTASNNVSIASVGSTPTPAATTPPPPASSVSPVTSTPPASTSPSSAPIGGGAAQAGEDAINWPALIKGAIRVIPVANISQLSAAAASAQPGDVILLRDGIYEGATVYIRSNGTAQRPVVYAAQNPGKAIFRGSARRALEISGRYNIIGGLRFERCASPAVFFRRATDNRLTDSEFYSCGTIDIARIVELRESSHRNRFDHLLFDDMRANGIGVFLEGVDVANGPSSNTRIDHNVFRNSSAGASNGREAVQIGQGTGWSGGEGTSDLMARAIIESNLFQNVTRETVEIKSSGNIVRNNRFVNVNGRLSIREGSYNLVEGNYLENTSGGIGVQGEYNTIINNVIYGSKSGSGISMMAYGTFQLSATKYSSFPPTGRNIVANNTIIDAYKAGIEIGRIAGYTGMKMANLPPYNNVIVNNIIVGSTNDLLRFVSGTGTVVSNNLFFTKGTASVGYAGANAIVADPRFAPGSFKLSSGSPARDRGTGTSAVKVDFDGKQRGSVPDIGAFEY